MWREPSEFWLGVSDAVAGGMMAAASMSLAWEGCSFDEVRAKEGGGGGKKREREKEERSGFLI